MFLTLRKADLVGSATLAVVKGQQHAGQRAVAVDEGAVGRKALLLQRHFDLMQRVHRALEERHKKEKKNKRKKKTEKNKETKNTERDSKREREAFRERECVCEREREAERGRNLTV